MVGETDQPEHEVQFNTGYEVGTAELATELQDRMYEQGFDPDEIEALFDPAPRRGHKKHHRSSRSRGYDPAPRKGKRKITAKRGGKQAKIMAAIKKYVPPGIGLLTFYGAYVKRAEELFAAGSIPEKSIFKAIEYDIKNFNGTDAMNRVKSNAGNILTPFIAGWGIKETGILGKWSGLAGDSATWFGIATLAKTVLDPPLNNNGANGRLPPANNTGAAKNIITINGKHGNCPNCQDQNNTAAAAGSEMIPYNPYMPGRGF